LRKTQVPNPNEFGSGFSCSMRKKVLNPGGDGKGRKKKEEKGK
jgi:hypothetical protein